MTRVAAFAVAAVATFALAFGGGRAAGLEPRAVAAPAHTEAMVAEAHEAEPAGLAVAEDGYRLVPERTSVAAGSRSDYVFRIVGPGGRTVRDFDVEHERRLHLVVVRRELDVFLHLHPEQRQDGAWVARLALPSAGTYRVFADFTTGGERRTLGVDLFASGTPEPPAAPAPRYEVVLRDRGERLEFDVADRGRPVEVEPYLGASGHLVVLREGDLAYVHAHAEKDSLSFDVPFPTAGSYRLFLQFKVAGVVETTMFRVGV
ncbi:MAG TPA: hypothetical protein VNT58_00030 [Gaiellaceae bacterium]|nr:hypothetical protein [Gaiellaceae bacterium]